MHLQNLFEFCRPQLTARSYNSPGILLITNTLEKFKTTSKEKLLEDTSQLVCVLCAYSSIK